MAPGRQNSGVKFPSAVALTRYEQSAAIGSSAAGASTRRATGIPIGNGAGLETVRGGSDGSGLGVGLVAGADTTEGEGAVGARLAPGEEPVQPVNRMAPASAPVHHMRVQRSDLLFGHDQLSARLSPAHVPPPTQFRPATGRTGRNSARPSVRRDRRRR